VKPVYIILAALLTVLFLLCAVCEVHAEDVIRIDDFSGGLNTKAGLFHIKPNQARECLNWDLSDEYGALKIRNGYCKVGQKNDTNSLQFLYTHYYRDGRKELFGVAKSDTASWGCLYRSGDADYTLDTNIYNFLYTGSKWSATSWKDKVIFANGRQRPLIWNGTVCKPLAIPSPGVPDVVPINGSGNLDGEYYYFLYYNAPGWARESALTPRIKANNENMLLFHFPIMQADSAWPSAFSGDWDKDTTTLEFLILRSKALKPGDGLDSLRFYPIKYFNGSVDTGYFVMPMSAMDTFTWIDTIADCYFGDSAGFTSAYRCWHTSRHLSKYFGSPGYLSRENSSAERKKKVILDTLSTGDSVLATLYMVTYFDSTNVIESDSGRAFTIYPQAYDDTMYYRISIPPAPPNDSNMHRIIYKAFMVRSVIYGDSNLVNNKYTYPILQVLSPAKSANVIGIDTILTPFYQIAVIGNKDSLAFTDSTLWDSVSSLGISYTNHSAPVELNSPFIFNDKMWGFQGSQVMWSYLDSVGYWGAWDWIAFNLDNGDEITAIVPDREYINIYKNHSQYVLYQDADGQYTKKWTVRGRGCVAGETVQFYDGNIIYLDENGVYMESAMPAKDKGTQRAPLSEPIADLIDYPISELDDAIGFIYDDKYMLSFPDKDTAYVYDFKVDAWSIYDFAFKAAVNYDTRDNDGLVPSSDMLFITGSDSAIYKFDTTATDNGADIIARWKSGPIARSARNVQINNMGFWTGNDTSFSCVLYDAEDTACIDSMKIAPDDRHYLKSPAINESNYFYIKITNLPDTTAGLEINGIDVYVKQGTAEINH